MKILGIETSCDETAASVVENGCNVLSHVVASSLHEHKKYGGIIPEIASRHQLELINSVTQEALAKARLDLCAIDAVAVTKSPGLIGSLLVGISFARALSFSIEKPLIEMDHIRAHLYANFLRLSSIAKGKKTLKRLPRLPAIGLVVSGGHTSLFFIKRFNDFKILGQTRDDAVGEAFDKVARILDLGYPGGPVIDRLAQKGENRQIRFKHASLPNSYDFSFSGIKTAVLYFVRAHREQKNFSPEKVCFAFQDSIVSNLVEKCIAACLKKKVKTLVVGGGVAANSVLRKRLTAAGQRHDIDVFFPPMNFCIDNAAMIAGLAYHTRKNN